MGIEILPNEMGIPALLIVAVIVISLAMWLLDLLFPGSSKPVPKSGPR